MHIEHPCKQGVALLLCALLADAQAQPPVLHCCRSQVRRKRPLHLTRCLPDMLCSLRCLLRAGGRLEWWQDIHKDVSGVHWCILAAAQPRHLCNAGL